MHGILREEGGEFWSNILHRAPAGYWLALHQPTRLSSHLSLSRGKLIGLRSTAATAATTTATSASGDCRLDILRLILFYYFFASFAWIQLLSYSTTVFFFPDHIFFGGSDLPQPPPPPPYKKWRVSSGRSNQWSFVYGLTATMAQVCVNSLKRLCCQAAHPAVDDARRRFSIKRIQRMEISSPSCPKRRILSVVDVVAVLVAEDIGNRHWRHFSSLAIRMTSKQTDVALSFYFFLFLHFLLSSGHGEDMWTGLFFFSSFRAAG